VAYTTIMNQPRLATVEDMPRVLELIQELAEFEKEPNAVEVTVKDLIADGYGDEPRFICFVIEIDAVIQGIALVFFRYSTWKGKVLHLEDLIVSNAMRGKGLGTLLLDEVVKFGHAHGVRRISWDVLDWNENAITFYEKKGATILKDWRVVHLNEEAIHNYIEQL